MLYLKDIKVDGNRISARVIPVSKTDTEFRIVVNARNGDVIEHTHGEMDSFVSMAVAHLMKMYIMSNKGKRMAKEDVVAWY